MKKIINELNKNVGVAVVIAAILLGLSHMIYGYMISSAQIKVGTSAFGVEKIAVETDLNLSKWQECLEDKTIANEVASSTEDGVIAGVTGTPTSFVVVKEDDGYHLAAKIEGARDYAYVKAAIDTALSGNVSKELFRGSAVQDSELVSGTRNKVFMIEYADAECPFCIAFHPTVDQIMAEYKDKIGYVYRNFPLVSIHKNAEKRAKAIVCAGKVGGSEKYFDYIKRFYEGAGQQ